MVASRVRTEEAHCERHYSDSVREARALQGRVGGRRRAEAPSSSEPRAVEEELQELLRPHLGRRLLDDRVRGEAIVPAEPAVDERFQETCRTAPRPAARHLLESR